MEVIFFDSRSHLLNTPIRTEMEIPRLLIRFLDDLLQSHFDWSSLGDLRLHVLIQLFLLLELGFYFHENGMTVSHTFQDNIDLHPLLSSIHRHSTSLIQDILHSRIKFRQASLLNIFQFCCLSIMFLLLTSPLPIPEGDHDPLLHPLISHCFNLIHN